jgi:hypothetical protein
LFFACFSFNLSIIHFYRVFFYRYKKFSDAKTLAGRSAEEKKAIFGHVVSSATPSSTASPAPVVKSQSAPSLSELDKKQKKEKKEKKEKKRKRSDSDEE